MSETHRHNFLEKQKIIAIGGAKGGTGKSLLASNIGILFAKEGKETVLVDLDLGSANLHLYLGETFLKYQINDYINKKINCLEEVVTTTKYDLKLIGGDSSALGSPNIHFTQKLKLLKSIKQINAEYIILDLGGDTSLNVLDFFLAADHGIVITSCNPASYLSAYNFIKVALYRKLTRLFGPESEYRKHKNISFQQFIHHAIMSQDTQKKTVKELIDHVRISFPEHLSLLLNVLSAFQPFLIINQVTENCHPHQITNRLQKVAMDMLSIEIKSLGNFKYQSIIESLAMELIPFVIGYPYSSFTRHLKTIVDRLIADAAPVTR